MILLILITKSAEICLQYFFPTVAKFIQRLAVNRNLPSMYIEVISPKRYFRNLICIYETPKKIFTKQNRILNTY